MGSSLNRVKLLSFVPCKTCQYPSHYCANEQLFSTIVIIFCAINKTIFTPQLSCASNACTRDATCVKEYCRLLSYLRLFHDELIL